MRRNYATTVLCSPQAVKCLKAVEHRVNKSQLTSAFVNLKSLVVRPRRVFLLPAFGEPESRQDDVEGVFADQGLGGQEVAVRRLL